MKKVFLVEVTETLQRIVKVKAESLTKAEEIVIQGYDECLIVLDAENFTENSFKGREVNEDDDLSLYEETLIEDENNGDIYWETKE